MKGLRRKMRNQSMTVRDIQLVCAAAQAICFLAHKPLKASI